MAISIETIATGLDTATAASDRTPHALAAAAISAGYLGRALVTAASVEEASPRNAAYNAMVAQLGHACAELGASAPLAESRTTMLAAAMADAIGQMLPVAAPTDRRVLITRAVDSLTPLLDLLGDLPAQGQPRERLERIEVLADAVLHEASRMKISQDAHWILHRDIAAEPRHATDPSVVELPAAMSVLLGLTTAGKAMSVSDVLQVSIACETVARRGEQLRTAHEPLLPKDVTAADSWLAVQATLTSIRDHDSAQDDRSALITTAALMVTRTAMTAAPHHLAMAAQQLPDIGDDLCAAAGRWTPNVLDRRTSPLPGEHRAPPPLKDAVVRVSRALDGASRLSVVHADEIGHRLHVRPDGWTQHHDQAHGIAFADAVGEAQAAACNYLRPNFLAVVGENERRRTATGHQPQKGAAHMTTRRAAEESLPAGYKITESGIPGAPVKYQVLHGTGRAQQFLGVRSERGEAEQLAHQHHSRLEAQRAAQLRAPRPPAPGPRR